MNRPNFDNLTENQKKQFQKWSSKYLRRAYRRANADREMELAIERKAER